MGFREEDVFNDTYGRRRMYQALTLKQPEGITVPSERTVYRIMKHLGLIHCPKRWPNSITKEERKARTSDDLLKRDFFAEKALEKCVTDITEIKAKDGKLYVLAIFDCFDLSALGLAMDDNMRARLCAEKRSHSFWCARSGAGMSKQQFLCHIRSGRATRCACRCFLPG